jgi:hypothetical protein
MEKRRTYMLLPGSWTEKFSFDFRGAVLRSSSSLSGDQRVADVAWLEKALQTRGQPKCSACLVGLLRGCIGGGGSMVNVRW